MKQILAKTPAPVDAPTSLGAFGEDSPETARNSAIAPIDRAAAHMSVAAANDLDAARTYMEAYIRARGRAYVEQALPDLQKNWPAKIEP